MSKDHKDQVQSANRKFPSGTALMVLLSMSRHDCAGVAVMRTEIREVSKIDLSYAGMHAALKNLVSRKLTVKKKLQREGSLGRGEHGSMFCYELSDDGRQYLKWMIASIEGLKKVPDNE